ncbi:MAG: isoprenylcysteine carboxylmethyltransferase family protein [Proteobacteria bacterium]|nr:isoprenylcysteine carboxylmethyltransferase family protein [Pseudomonadota bacterium]
MKVLLVSLALISFGIYTHAIRYLFSRAGGVAPRMKVLQLLGTISAIVQIIALAASTPTTPRFAAAMILYGGGLLVFFWARRSLAGRRFALAFSPDDPGTLVTSGIYRYVRHPFYLAYTLTWVAGVAAAPSLWTGITAGCMVAMYVYAARTEESRFKLSGAAEEYEAYRSRAGLFLPRLRVLVMGIRAKN